jgi:hypothetical protein
VGDSPASGTAVARRDPELQGLFDDITRARDDHRRELGKRMDPTLVSFTRRAWRDALVRYVAGLEERSLPTPPTIHRDLEILEALCRSVQKHG